VRRSDVRFLSRRRVDGLSVKPGPTIGLGTRTVGGVVLPAVNYLLVGLLLLLVLSMAFLFYRKRDAVLRFFAPFLTRFRIF
jgi:hypothetical protein